MNERLIKVFVDGFPAGVDVVDMQGLVIAALAGAGLTVKRVTIGNDTFINPEWASKP